MGAGLTSQSSALPQPGRSIHPVGVVDLLTADGPNGDSGIFARLFYPAEPDANTFDILTREDDTHLPVWIDRKEYIVALLSQLKTLSKRGQWLAEWIIGERRIRCVRKATLATTETIQSRLPLIIYSHGIGGSRHLHSSFCSSLASYGFVVAAIEHRDYSACWTYRLIDESPISSTTSVRGRLGRTMKPMTFLDVSEVDSRKENRTRNQQIHKRVAECVRLLHFLEECDMGMIKGYPCSSCSSSSASSSDTTSMFSFSSDEYHSERHHRKTMRESACQIPLHARSFQNTNGASQLLIGDDYDWTQFTDRLDFSEVTIMGDGLGGATALASCSFTTDFQNAIVLDGLMRPLDMDVYSRVVQPVLFLNRPGGASSDAQSKFEDAESITLMDAEQYTFSDLSLLLRPFVGRRFRLNGTTDADQMADTVVKVCMAFLRMHQSSYLTDTASPSVIASSVLPSPISVKDSLLEESNYSINPYPPLTPDDTEIFL